MVDATTAASIQHPLLDGNPPEWATAWGQDRYGIFADFGLDDAEGNWVSQRMRWIPAGRFTMGSPDDEPGRWDDEGPQHEVTISQSFWMFDTPCTQGLWKAVMDGESPSYFQDDERPVEQVIWEEAREFINRLNSKVSDLSLVLPTEAQWEYACRAGTKEATHAGLIEILAEYDAPILDEIAWYGGNSGVDFELDNGVDSSSWPGKQYDHTQAGTRKVGKKRPNDWGLFDMLGNVWEWCSDWSGAYEAESQLDPTGPEEGLSRVLRGGGWGNTARLARSAARDGSDPGLRFRYIGFRCAQVQES